MYELEARLRELTVDFRTRQRLRQKIAYPLVKKIHAWLKAVWPSVPPKSALAHAIHYTLTQWPYLINYLRHGYAEIDTNGVENKIREVALGRKNWLFIGTQDSGQIHALFYSLVVSALLNKLNPRVYMHYLLTQIHGLRKGTVDPYRLLPHTIDHALLKKFADEQIEWGKRILADSS